ncbi:hypothetical protein MJ579_10040 [Klebsiella pneumoniae]|nr:hypothetical protein MJ579_10040 [Klebsiella pneumoniae]
MIIWPGYTLEKKPSQAELFLRASVISNATAFLDVPILGAHQPRHFGSRLMGFCCLKFIPFKIMMLEALFLTMATKWRQRQRESATCPDFIGCG